MPTEIHYANRDLLSQQGFIKPTGIYSANKNLLGYLQGKECCGALIVL